MPFLPRTVDAGAAARLARDLSLHPVTAQILLTRGMAEVEKARLFLRAGPELIREPEALQDMDRATAMIAAAIHAGERIAIYGDYDVDGVCGTAVLCRALGLLGAHLRPFIPHRVADGYGLSGEALTRLREEGCTLVITVDNGTTRPAEVAEAVAGGLKVIITDHHEATGPMPDCPLVNPKRPDASYPFTGLAGCGVAYKLALALARRMGRLDSAPFRALLPDLTGLVAVGTIADVVPLVDENRALVALGLRALAATRHPGLRALLAVSQCNGRALRTTDIAFKIGPRINAAGRLDSAHAALDLLLCEEAPRAVELARQLDAGNRERQRIEKAQAETAMAEAETQMRAGDSSALVLASADWHPGVIGIVAARVAGAYRRPAALIAIEGSTARGSARSSGGVRLHEALDRCSEHLLTHGGHAFAAGFTLRAEKLGAFRSAFLRAVAEQTPSHGALREVDAALPIEAITPGLAQEIESLGPFGTGNEEPLFCVHGARVAGYPQRVGVDQRHLAFYAAGRRRAVRAVAWQQAGAEELLKGPFDFSFHLRPRDGPEGVELFVREILPAQ